MGFNPAFKGLTFSSQSRLRLQTGPLFPVFSYWILVCTNVLHYGRFMCLPSHALFHQPDNTPGIQVAKLLVVQFPPDSCCFLSLRSKYCPQTLDNPVFLLTFLQEATRWPLQFGLKIKHSFSRVQLLSRVHGYKNLRSI